MIDIVLPKNVVHIYKSSIDLSQCEYDDFYITLSINEQKKVNNLLKLEDKKRFLLGRYILRKQLKKYLGKSFDGIDLFYNKYQKPMLFPEKNCIEFNISHAHNIVLVAFARTVIGIDIEFKRKIDANVINSLILTNKELIHLNKLSYLEKIEKFFEIWVSKESYIKALGKGFYFPVNTIEINFRNNFNQIIDRVGNIKQDFIIRNLDILEKNYCAAIALPNKNMNIEIRNTINS